MLSHVNHFDHAHVLAKLHEAWADQQAGKISPQEWGASIRYASEKCLSIFLYYVLGYMDIDNDFHDRFIARVEEQQDHDIFLLPRFHLKTSIFIEGDLLWTAAKNPQMPQGLGSDTLGRAKGFLRGVRLLCETRKELNAFWPEIFWKYPERESKKWTEDELLFRIVPEGAKGAPAKEASITAFGFEALPTGSHFGKINGDDLVNEKNTNTKELIEKIEINFGLARGICPIGPIRLSGTIYAFGDLHDKFSQKKNWRVLKESAHDEGFTNIRFPAKFTPGRLEELRSDMGPYLYSCQFLLDPIDPENAAIRRQWIQYFEDWKPGPYRSYITIDLAYSTETTADYTVIMHTKRDTSRHLYVTDYIRRRMTVGALITATFDMAKRIPTLAGIWVEIPPGETETNSTVLFAIREEMKKRGEFYRLEGIKPVNDKSSRAQPLIALMANGMVYIRKSMTELEDEMLRFPKGEHDDLVDALAYAASIPDAQAAQRRKLQPVVDDETIGW